MRRGMNPLAILLLIVILAAAIAFAFFVKGILPEHLSQWSNLIFWGILIAIGGIGAVLAGKLGGRR